MIPVSLCALLLFNLSNRYIVGVGVKCFQVGIYGISMQLVSNDNQDALPIGNGLQFRLFLGQIDAEPAVLFQRQRSLDAVNRPAVRVVEHRLQNLRNSFIRQVDMHEIMHHAVALDVVCTLSNRHIVGVGILCFQVSV